MAYGVAGYQRCEHGHWPRVPVGEFRAWLVEGIDRHGWGLTATAEELNRTGFPTYGTADAWGASSVQAMYRKGKRDATPTPVLQ